jgi:hypothetical protein
MDEAQSQLAGPAGSQGKPHRPIADRKLSTGMRRVVARQDLDQRRLPGPVLSDQAVNLGARDTYRRIVERAGSTEGL